LHYSQNSATLKWSAQEGGDKPDRALGIKVGGPSPPAMLPPSKIYGVPKVERFS